MNIETLLQKAVAQLHQGQLEQAESALGKILKKHPKHTDANHLQGIIAARRGQYEKAIKLIARAVKYNPRQPVFLKSLAQTLSNSGQLEQALSTYEQVIKLDSHNIGAYYNCGNILQNLGNPEAALAAFDQVIKLNPRYAEAYNNRAGILASVGKMEEALLACNQAIKIKPKYAGAYYNQGNALQSLGRLEEALAAYDLAIQFRPDYAEAHSNRGNVLFTLEQTTSALKAYEMALRLKPTLPEVHNNLGNVFIKLGRIPEAIKAFETELRLNPNATGAKYLLAAIGNEDTPQQSPEEYVSQLFNDYADRFDEHLVEKLQYDTPRQLYNSVKEHINTPSKKLDILDLGCGTGLCGVAFAEFINHLTGVDLAERMLAKANKTGVYNDLIQADVCQALEQVNRKFDLILSGDVFVYIGKLDEVFMLTCQRLNPGGLFAFSIEVDETADDYTLRQSGRYAQSPKYIQRLADASGLEQVSYRPGILRHDLGKPITGSVIVLRLPLQHQVS